jgi:hypothetical protein
VKLGVIQRFADTGGKDAGKEKIGGYSTLTAVIASFQAKVDLGYGLCRAQHEIKYNIT